MAHSQEMHFESLPGLIGTGRVHVTVLSSQPMLQSYPESVTDDGDQDATCLKQTTLEGVSYLLQWV
jgi:hypothetical protein